MHSPIACSARARQQFNLKPSSHNVSHYLPANGWKLVADKTHSELLARLIDKLAVREADGSSLFDNTAVAFGSNISSIHYLTNCPTVITNAVPILNLVNTSLAEDTLLCNVADDARGLASRRNNMVIARALCRNCRLRRCRSDRSGVESLSGMRISFCEQANEQISHQFPSY